MLSGKNFPEYFSFYQKISFFLNINIWDIKKLLKIEKKVEVPEYLLKTFNGKVTKSKESGRGINRSISSWERDLEIPYIKKICKEIIDLKKTLRNRNLKYTSWVGDFHSKNMAYEKNKLWEYAWTLGNSYINYNDRVLDIGGASSIFTFYLASINIETYVIDKDWFNCGLIENSNMIARKMGWWLKSIRRDAAYGIPFPANYFDKIYCICVFEHLLSEDRRRIAYEAGRVLKPGGVFSVTFDWDDSRIGDKGLRFANSNDIYNDIIIPSGLKIYGNSRLVDDMEEDFKGALFLYKPQPLNRRDPGWSNSFKSMESLINKQ